MKEQGHDPKLILSWLRIGSITLLAARQIVMGTRMIHFLQIGVE
jgi:hypothetical protein